MLSLGTYAGGWRIMRTLGRKIIELDPPQGFAAETTGASIMFTTAFLFKAPISTTHVITSAIMGVGRDQAGRTRCAGASPRTSSSAGSSRCRRRRSSPRCAFWIVDLAFL